MSPGISQVSSQFVVLVDGDTASGKGTVAAHLGQHFNLAYLDTGLVYRAAGLLCQRAGIAPEDTASAASAIRAWCAARDYSLLQDPHIRSVETGYLATIYAGQNPTVRAELFTMQQDFCRLSHAGKNGAVLDGRHLAFEIWPQAQVKFYITAAATERAKRREQQLIQQGLPATYLKVLEDVEQRDQRNNDMLMQKLGLNSVVAPDAIFIDTTHLSLVDTMALATAAVAKALALHTGAGTGQLA